MKLDTASLEKADDDLKAFFRAAESDDAVRVVLILGAGDEGSKRGSEGDVRPSDFSSPADYRHALIGRRKAQLKDSVGDTIDSLRQLSLQLSGGEIGRAIVAEGAAAQVLAALKLQGVSNAMLDRTIDLVRPKQGNDDQV